MVDLYDSTKGEAWLDNTDWLVVNETISPCDWAGVACVDGHVAELNLSGNGLTGALPASLSDLAFLTRFSIDRNADRRGHRSIRLLAGRLDPAGRPRL